MTKYFPTYAYLIIAKCAEVVSSNPQGDQFPLLVHLQKENKIGSPKPAESAKPSLKGQSVGVVSKTMGVLPYIQLNV